MSSFGVLLKQFRLSAGLTQEMLAGRARLSMRSIQYLERGLGQPHRDTSRRLAEALSLSAEQLLTFEALAAPSPRRPRQRHGNSSLGSTHESRVGERARCDVVDQAGGCDVSGTWSVPAPEQHLVTVVIADIVEPARYFRDLGREDAVNLLDAVLRSMRSAVGQLHGAVTKIDHEGMTVLFGAATDQQDAALLACCAATAMRDAVSRIPEACHDGRTVAPHVRFGIASGEVVVRPVNAALSTEYAAAGLPLHVASQMARLVAPARICLSAETMRLVEGRVQVRTLDPIAARGADQPMAAYELLADWTAQPLSRSLDRPVLLPMK